jgi:hypothetical protein
VAPCLPRVRARGHHFSRQAFLGKEAKNIQLCLTTATVNSLIQRRSRLTNSARIHTLFTISRRVLSILDRKHTTLHRAHARTRSRKAFPTRPEMAPQHAQAAILFPIREAGLGEETPQPFPGRALSGPLGRRVRPDTARLRAGLAPSARHGVLHHQRKARHPLTGLQWPESKFQ